MAAAVDVAAPRARVYRQAAVAYAIYGCVYLVGAVFELSPERRITFWGFVPWWAFYVAGAALIPALSSLVWRRYRRLTMVLSVLVAGKVLTLVWTQGRRLAAGEPPDLYNGFFAAVALTAVVMLARAGFGRASASHAAP